MKTDETVRLLCDNEFLDKLYAYAYRRCNTSYEAEDLCSEIIADILKAAKNGREIENFYAFVWTVAHRTYADFCRNKKAYSEKMMFNEYSDCVLYERYSQIDAFVDRESEKSDILRIIKEISFLAKIYRDVMIMYYIDGMKISQIAKKLDISETTVKQRLFSARNTVKKEVQKMENKNLLLKPVNLAFIGTGNPVGNDPSEKAKERLLSQNLIYLCKNEAKTAKELSEALCVPMPYIENEIELQCLGANGSYGLLSNLGGGKYISNIIIADASEYEEANGIYGKYLGEFCACLKTAVEKSADKIISFPFLNKQQDVRFILWCLISRPVWSLTSDINSILEEQYFKGIDKPKRDFTTAAVAVKENETLNMGFYGCDGIPASNLCGYSKVLFANIYSDRIDKHFGCGHNLSTDPHIIMTLRSVGGLKTDSLTEPEKEIAAKAIECGYLKKDGDILEPKILVLKADDEAKFYNLLSDFEEDSKRIAEKIAGDMADYIKKHIPKHLLCEYQYYNSLIASVRLMHDTVEECIKEGLLVAPESKVCAEGTYLVVGE